jgi:hypothetical protein
MKRVLIFIISCLTILPVYTQGEIDNQDKIFYRDERTFSAFLTSNGFGGNYRYGKRQNARNKRLYEIDFLSVKHPKETKLSTPQIYNTRSFVYGKTNSFFALRPLIGFQQELYRKIDKGGISIRYFYAGGPAIGLYKPIYYEVLTSVSPDNRLGYFDTQKFDPSIQHTTIYGRASFFKGLKETKIVPGATFKLGTSFEYSTVDELIHAIELGVSVDAFIKKIPIMAIDRNPRLFVSLFLGYRFGKVINAGVSAKSKEEKEAIDF